MNNNNSRRGNTQKPIKNNSVNIPELVSGSCRSMKKEEALNKSSFRAPLRSGFTLIELLVVVLIIGILATIALPQYQRVVAKARLVEAVTVVSTMQKAIDIYVLENGMNGMTLDKLDIDVSAAYDKVCGAAGEYTCSIGCFDDEDGAECFVQLVANSKGKVDLMTGRTKTENWRNNCSPANPEDKMAEFLCSSLRAQGWN